MIKSHSRCLFDIEQIIMARSCSPVFRSFSSLKLEVRPWSPSCHGLVMQNSYKSWRSDTWHFPAWLIRLMLVVGLNVPRRMWNTLIRLIGPYRRWAFVKTPRDFALVTFTVIRQFHIQLLEIQLSPCAWAVQHPHNRAPWICRWLRCPILQEGAAPKDAAVPTEDAASEQQLEPKLIVRVWFFWYN